ncbi:hypothetical protein [Actinomadura hibisca]|uniref:hypothetical protein n=1 Tax=Actinomadura hibisca TaxID=68565 RepID=UPI001FE0CE5A|nr:hypothetical protein [Actinomadura hibisca]
MSAALTPEDFRGFLHDAAMFPPGDLPLEKAVPAHLEHQRAWYRKMVSFLVVPAARLDDLPELPDGGSVTLSVTFPQGPDMLEQVVTRVVPAPGYDIEATEIAVPEGVTPEDLLSVVDEALHPGEVTGYVEVPRDDRRDAVLDVLAGTRYGAKFRTGGLTPEAHPSEAELAHLIHGAVTRGLYFKCTAGLHHAVRHTDGDLEQHGFLNVLLATDAALDGAGPADLAALLADRSPAFTLDAARLTAVRRVFQGIGTCSIADPVNDLLALGLIEGNRIP